MGMACPVRYLEQLLLVPQLPVMAPAPARILQRRRPQLKLRHIRNRRARRQRPAWASSSPHSTTHPRRMQRRDVPRPRSVARLDLKRLNRTRSRARARTAKEDVVRAVRRWYGVRAGDLTRK